MKCECNKMHIIRYFVLTQEMTHYGASFVLKAHEWGKWRFPYSEREKEGKVIEFIRTCEAHTFDGWGEAQTKYKIFKVCNNISRVTHVLNKISRLKLKNHVIEIMST